MADDSPSAATRDENLNLNNNNGGSPAIGTGNEYKAKTQPKHQHGSPGQGVTSSAPTPQVGIQSSPNQLDPLTEFDEYGTELRRDARVWRVYVEEADKYDNELVERWRSSIDMILLFSALFSAISTVFLIESSKKLREDPADVSAQTLLAIAQTLRELTNRTESPSATTPPRDDSGFTPTRTIVLINTLWYLSLSLSLATTFISILAKDWCNSFLSGRTGHPYDQSQKRQRKWDMIERWKMPELLAVLPSLIHAALFLFAIGLCIYLWDMNVAVAIPVVCVSGVATSFYIWSSIMGIITNNFPYPTIISRMYRTELAQRLVQIIRGGLPKIFSVLWYSLEGLQGAIFSVFNHPIFPSRPHWCRRNISLIFVKHSIVQGLHKKARKWETSLLWKWLSKVLATTSLRIDDTGNADVTSLALSWLIKYCETPQSIDIALQSIAGANQRIPRQPLRDCEASLKILERLASSNLYKHSGSKADAIISLYSARNETESNLEVLIWDLHTEMEKKVAESVRDGSFQLTKPNLDAMRLGNTAASNSLRLWKGDNLSHYRGTHNIDEVLKSIQELLESYLNNPHSLHYAALLSLVHSASLLSLFVSNSPTASALASLCVRLADSKRGGRTWLIAALSTTCALVCNKYLDSNPPNPPHGLAWTEQVVQTLIRMYSQGAHNLEALERFSDCALQELLTHQETYHTEDLNSAMQSSLVNYNFSKPLDREIWDNSHPQRSNEGIASKYLQALQDVSSLIPLGTPRPHDHLLIHEVMCHAWVPSSPKWADSVQLISKCRFSTLSHRLTWVLEQRDIIPMLGRMKAADDIAAQFFATGQLWLLFTLYLHSSTGTENDRNNLSAQLRRFNGGLESEWNTRRDLGEQIVQIWNESQNHWQNYIGRTLGVWAYRLMECVFESQDRALQPGFQRHLAHISSDLRGLSSFTQSTSNLEILVWGLQTRVAKKVAVLITDGHFKPTKPNLEAIRIGSAAASNTLRQLKRGHHHIDANIDEVVRSICELLASYPNNSTSLHDAALLSLVHAASLLSLLVPNSSRASALALSCAKLANFGHNWNALISALASMCALACRKPQNWGHFNNSLPHGIAWTERAVRALLKMHSQKVSALARFSDCALQELATHQEVYHIESLYPIMRDLVTYNFSYGQGYEDVWNNSLFLFPPEDTALAHLQALQDVSDLTPAGTPRPHAHLLVHEVMCRSWQPSSPSWAYCVRLISECGFQSLSHRLTWVLDQREIIPLLERMRDARSPAARFFATGQLWLLFTLSLDPYASGETERDRNQLHYELHRFDEYGPHLKDIDQHERLGKQIEQIWSENSWRIIGTLGTWAHRLMECVLESQNRPLPWGLRGSLVDISPGLRSLSSFTQWRPRPIEPSVTVAQVGDVEDISVSDTADRTPATDAYEHEHARGETRQDHNRTGNVELGSGNRGHPTIETLNLT